MPAQPTNLRSPALALMVAAALLSVPALAFAAPKGVPARHGHAASTRCAGKRLGANARRRPRCAKTRPARQAKPGKRQAGAPAPRLTATPQTVANPTAGAQTATAASPPPPAATAPAAVSAAAAPVPATEAQSEFAPTLGEVSIDGETIDPIDPRFLTSTPFGTSSFWIQPWRAYLDTWPASRLLESLGINFNVHSSEAEATARLLQESGFKLARIGIGWGSLSYENPSRFVNEAGLRAKLAALKKHGLRPLILLNADSTGPAPAERVTLNTTAPAPAGAQTVTLSAASARQVVPGKTGFDDLTFGGSPDLLIASVSAGGVATLSRPLPEALPAGEHNGTTLRYAPFGPPTLAAGQPNPAFQETLSGWLSYVGAVNKLAAGIYGPGGYDLEVWNELSFDSQFLNSAHYYSPSVTEPKALGEATEPEPDTEELERAETETSGGTPNGAVTKEVERALLVATVGFVRDPANGIGSGVGVSDGFADQTPFVSGAQAPVGLTALSKHLYAGAKQFPASYKERSIRPLDALGARDTQPGSFTPLFIPHFQSLFPEYYLTALSTETVTRDLAPFTTSVYGDPHGRNAGPEGGTPPQKWMTEYNLSTHGATPMLPDQSTPASTTITTKDKRHFQAKALLRSLVAMVDKGMTREYFFAAQGGQLGTIDPAFFTALETHPSTYPGQAAGGETMTAFKNMLSQFQGPGPGPGTELKQLNLLSIAQDGDHAQFTGDGTPQHPSLYDREALAVFPFQSAPRKYVIPVYVMTRDLLTLYKPTAPTTDPTRFDLPNETFQITLQNLPATTPATTFYDPITDKTIPVTTTKPTPTTTTVTLQATDYPRVLTLNY